MQKQGATVQGINRKGLVTGIHSPIIFQARKIPTDFVLDGEWVGDVLHAFDLLRLGENSLVNRPYEYRWAELAGLLDAPYISHIELVETALTTHEKTRLWQRLKKERREGVVFKRLDAPYTPGRPSSGGTQLKHKFHATLSAVVAQVNARRSVEVKLLNDEGWRAAGNVTIPANHLVPKVGSVVEVRYLYAFKESGSLYQPVYLGERRDVAQMECLATQLKFKASDGEEE